jgi:hypothetical protein
MAKNVQQPPIELPNRFEDSYREAVIHRWLGHSRRIGQKHYSQVRPEDWSNAIGGSTGGSISAKQGTLAGHQEFEEDGKRLVLMGTDRTLMKEEYPRKDSNLGPGD